MGVTYTEAIDLITVAAGLPPCHDPLLHLTAPYLKQKVNRDKLQKAKRGFLIFFFLQLLL